MGFAEGFSAGSNAVTRGIQLAATFRENELKQKQLDQQASEQLRTESANFNKQFTTDFNRFSSEANKYREIIANPKSSEEQYKSALQGLKTVNSNARQYFDSVSSDSITPWANNMLKTYDDSEPDMQESIEIYDKAGNPRTVYVPSAFKTEYDRNSGQYVVGEDNRIWQKELKDGNFTNSLLRTEVPSRMFKTDSDNKVSVYIDGKEKRVVQSIADKLVNQGVATTTNPMGSKGIQGEYWYDTTKEEFAFVPKGSNPQKGMIPKSKYNPDKHGFVQYIGGDKKELSKEQSKLVYKGLEPLILGTPEEKQENVDKIFDDMSEGIFTIDFAPTDEQSSEIKKSISEMALSSEDGFNLYNAISAQDGREVFELVNKYREKKGLSTFEEQPWYSKLISKFPLTDEGLTTKKTKLDKMIAAQQILMEQQREQGRTQNVDFLDNINY